MKILRYWFACTFALLAGEAAAQTESRPPLIYTMTVKSETVDSSSLGLVAGLIGEGYRKAHEQFLAAITDATTNDTLGILRPLACFDGECRRIRAESTAATSEGLAALLAAEPTRSARLAHITVIFDGRFFQVPASLYDAKLDASGNAVLEHPTHATYIRTYSRSQHADDISSGRNELPFDGKLGSRDARLHFWMGGSSPRLLQELPLAFELIAALWHARLSPASSGELSATMAARETLPRVRDLIGQDRSCKALHGNFPVVKDLGEYLWLAVPGDASKVADTLFIEPRCGFDF